ncbi:MAG: DUF3769 domain-containing protein [Cyanobacteriota bacterium]
MVAGLAGAEASASGFGLLPEELLLSANHQEFDAQSQRFVASGNVMIVLAGGRLLSDRLEFDASSRTLLASGRVRFQRGQQYLQASRLRYSLSEGVGEIEDVYGILDLDGSGTDFNLEALPSIPLTAPQSLACSPLLPPLPQWRPFPWSATVWGGQMIDTNFGDTFKLQGRLRPEYLAGIGLQRRLLDGGPFSLEWDTTLMGHAAQAQAGGAYNQAVPYAETPAQSFGEITGGLGLRIWLQPWLNVFAVEGVSLLTSSSNYERTYREKSSTFLNYLAFEVEALMSPQWSAVGRIHHRSGAYGTYSGVREGSNAYLLGLRYRFGQAEPARPRVQVPPAQGCPGAPANDRLRADTLAAALEATAMGEAPTTADADRPSERRRNAPEARPGESAWSLAQRQEQEREQAIARLDQRVDDISFEQSLISEQRFGFPRQITTPDTVNQFGTVRPIQLQSLTTVGNQDLVRGTISRWRFQASRMEITPTALRADRAAMTNDPFTPAQSWMDAEGVTVTQNAKRQTIIKARRNRLVLDERLPIPVVSRTKIRSQVIGSRWSLNIDSRDRNGAFVGYELPSLRFGNSGSLDVQPQLLIQRAIDGVTNSYPLPGQTPDAPTVTQPTQTSDLFGLVAKLRTPLAGFQLNGTLDMSTLNPEHIPAGTRSWADLSREVTLPLVGTSTLRAFGAYRYRTWNGTLGQQDVYAAYGISLEDTGNLPNWGKLSSNYFWKLGAGNFQATSYSPTNVPTNLASYWRGNLIGSLNASLPLWTGTPLPLTRDQAYRHSAVPITPGLSLAANLTATVAAYGDGTYQNTLSLTGGPTLTLGHFQKPFLDYTQLTITGGGTLRQGLSPLGLDRAVDLGTLNFGLTQQIAGPLLFSGGVGFNVDPNSSNYGEVTNSYVELRWQQRAYEIGVFYNPYEKLGGVRIKLNDFNFQGTGLPFVPYEPTLPTSPARRYL